MQEICAKEQDLITVKHDLAESQIHLQFKHVPQKSVCWNLAWWHMPAIPVAQEAETEGASLRRVRH